MLYMYYDGISGHHEGMVTDEAVHFPSTFLGEDEGDDADVDEDDLVCKVIEAKGGTPVRQDGGEILYYEDFRGVDHESPEPMEWVTPISTYNRKEGVYATYGKMEMCHIRGDACMIVRIGKAGDRLGYPTAAQVKKAYKRGRDQRNYYNYY